MAHGRGMEWVASTLHTTSEHGVSSITTADAHNSTASSRLNWRPRRFKWTRPYRRKTKYGFCACAITFQTQSTLLVYLRIHPQYKSGVRFYETQINIKISLSFLQSTQKKLMRSQMSTLISKCKCLFLNGWESNKPTCIPIEFLTHAGMFKFVLME